MDKLRANNFESITARTMDMQQSIDLSFVSGKITFLDVLIHHRLAGPG